MSAIYPFCMCATTFTKSGELDETAFRGHLRRLAGAGIGLYLGSTAMGEGHTLSPAELRRIYAIAVEECKGRIPLHANIPEHVKATNIIESVNDAAKAGIEVSHVYTSPAWHSMAPTDAELIAYFDTIAAATDHPIAVGVNKSMGYVPSPDVVAEICQRNPRITIVRLINVPDAYLVKVMDLTSRSVAIHTRFESANMQALSLGVTGLNAAPANIIPKTIRKFMDHYENRDLEQLGLVYLDIIRFTNFIERWPGPRWIKMAMKTLKLPGGEGGLRPPHIMPPEAEQRAFLDGLLRLNLPEIAVYAAEAGVRGYA